MLYYNHTNASRKQQMKISELLNESKPEVTAETVEAAILKAIETVMTRDATILDFETDGPDRVMMEIVYDFPESRNGLGKDMKAALKGFGTGSATKMGPAYDPHLAIDIDVKVEFDEKRLTAAVKAKFKGRFARE